MKEVKGNFFKSDRFEYFILSVIIINAIIILLQESGRTSPLINIIDSLCTVIFIIEMIGKQLEFGFKEYWSDGWNRVDGVLVILSLPSLVSYFIPTALSGFSMLLILRLLRILRFTRLYRVFRDFDRIVTSLWMALKSSIPIFMGFLILIVISALFSCALFREVSPKYFGTPLDAIYSTFRLCTVEGWYDIPDSMSASLTTGQIVWVRIYFIFVLVCGGIIGLSLVNSIFVDAMVSDNNNELEKEVKELNDKIDMLTEEIRKLQTPSCQE